ncbi:MAG: flagellar hook-basal body complex protein FliE [Defluviitaleaceae bacterium]|nr:flagellar hook-basal body complex protein FliE [Defluviitaleaceae bacterium]
MNIERINLGLASPVLNNILNTNNQIVETNSSFSNILDSAIRMFDEASVLENEASNLQIDYATGRTDDLLAVMLAEQRAHTAVTFTTQLTSRILDAYRQIMNMQI